MSEIIVEMKDYLKIKGGKYIRDLVRCQDCKKYNTDDCMMIHGKKMNRNIFANDFCSYGERKGE